METQEGNPRRKKAEDRSQILNVRGVFPKAGALVPVSSFAVCQVFLCPLSTCWHRTEAVKPLDAENSFSCLVLLFLPAFFFPCYVTLAKVSSGTRVAT